LRLSWPLTGFDRTGLQEVRFRTFVDEPDTAQMHTSLNWQVRVVGTGKPLSNVTRMPYLRGKGWYGPAGGPVSGYCEASDVSVPIPDGPIAGLWQPTVRMDTHSSDASLPVTSYFATLDADFHADPPNPGTVLLDSAGTWPSAPLTIDTITLANGLHRLLLRSDCRDDTQSSTNRGVLIVPFVVAN